MKAKPKPKGVPDPGERARALLRGARRLYSSEQVQTALDRMAAILDARLQTENPLVLVVMTGGMWPGVELSRRLAFPHQIDYLHATRYRGGTRGGELEWRARPRLALSGRAVLVVDDILDEGHTLAAVLEHCRASGARSVASAVLVDKQHERRVPGLQADVAGLQVDDVYVFGCGMDVEEYWRGLPEIYALPGVPR